MNLTEKTEERVVGVTLELSPEEAEELHAIIAHVAQSAFAYSLYSELEGILGNHDEGRFKPEGGTLGGLYRVVPTNKGAC